MNRHARVNIFGHGLGAEPADLQQDTAAKQSTASCKEGTIVAIATSLKHTIEQRLLVLERSLELKIPLKHVGVVEMMRRLDKRNLFVLEKSDRVLQKTVGWNMIDVEDRNDFSRGFLQGMVQIPSFRILSIRPADVSTVQRPGQCLNLVSLTIVEHMHLIVIFGIVLV